MLCYIMLTATADRCLHPCSARMAAAAALLPVQLAMGTCHQMPRLQILQHLQQHLHRVAQAVLQAARAPVPALLLH